MKTPILITTLFTAGTMPLAFAQSDGESPEEKKESVKVVVESSNKAFITGPDGKTMEIDLDEDHQVFDHSGHDGWLERLGEELEEVELSEEARDAVSNALKKAHEAMEKAGKGMFRSGIIVENEDEGYGPGQIFKNHLARHWKSNGTDWVEQHFGGDSNPWNQIPFLTNRHVIGLKCSPINQTLRSQLGLESGIAVEDVFKDTPAEQAGVEKHDILTKAGGRDLDSVDDLVEAVQEAGEDQEPLALTLMREGEERIVQVKPEKRETNRMLVKMPGPSRESKIERLEDEIAELREAIEDLRDQLLKGSEEASDEPAESR